MLSAPAIRRMTGSELVRAYQRLGKAFPPHSFRCIEQHREMVFQEFARQLIQINPSERRRQRRRLARKAKNVT